MASCTCDRADCYNCVFERGYQLGLNAYILDTDRSHPMTANPKPLLTRREIEHERQVLNEMEKFREIDSVLPKVKVGAFIDGQNKRLDCIEAMAKLLERWQKSQTPTTRMLISRQELESLWMETNQTVQTFNATGGEGS